VREEVLSDGFFQPILIYTYTDHPTTYNYFAMAYPHVQHCREKNKAGHRRKTLVDVVKSRASRPAGENDKPVHIQPTVQANGSNLAFDTFAFRE
jgi:hypothetical protein